jgi:hypothetical protein
LRFVIELLPEHTAFDTRRPSDSVHAHTLHPGEVEDHTTVACTVAGNAVPAAAYRE